MGMERKEVVGRKDTGGEAARNGVQKRRKERERKCGGWGGRQTGEETFGREENPEED